MKHSSLALVVCILILSASLVGCKGPQGVQGPEGLHGLQGIEGPEGEQGEQGEQGPEGGSVGTRRTYKREFVGTKISITIPELDPSGDGTEMPAVSVFYCIASAETRWYPYGSNKELVVYIIGNTMEIESYGGGPHPDSILVVTIK